MTTAPTAPTARPLTDAVPPAARAPQPAGTGQDGPGRTTAERLRTAALWLRDTGLGGFGFALVLVVAFAGWAASFIGLHDFGVHHMGLTHTTAWLVPITFDGAPAGLSIVVARASINGRTAPLWRFLIIVFTALSSWINYQHIDDPLGRIVAAFMPPSAVILFEGLMSEVRAAAVRRTGRERPRLHPLRWFMDRPGTWAIYRAYVLGIELPENLRTAAVHPAAGPDRTADNSPVRSTQETDRTVDRTTPLDRTAAQRTAELDRTATGMDRTGGPDRTLPPVDRTAPRGPQEADRTAAVHPAPSTPDRAPAVDRTAGPDRAPAAPRQRTAPPVDRTATPTPTTRSTAGPDRTADVALNDIEQEAMDLLRSNGRSISKRSIADTVRTELGRSIASDRAAEIARHYRTLQSA